MAVKLVLREEQILRLAGRLAEISREYHDLSEPLELVGIRLQGTREEIFQLQGSPRRWQKSERATREGGQTLIDSRSLLNSLTASSAQGAISEVTPRTVEVGSALVHALPHEKGMTIEITRTLKKPKRGGRRVVKYKVRFPRRRFLNLRRQDLDAIVEVLESWQLGLFDRAGEHG